MVAIIVDRSNSDIPFEVGRIDLLLLHSTANVMRAGRSP